MKMVHFKYLKLRSPQELVVLDITNSILNVQCCHLIVYKTLFFPTARRCGLF